MVGRRLSLVPLSEGHAEDLRTQISPEICRYLLSWRAHEDPAEFRKLIHKIASTSGLLTYAVVLHDLDKAVGSTAFLDIRDAHRGVEIGATWIGSSYQGTFVNSEMKLLMLEHAFGPMARLRIQMKCDARNEHSRRAMLKLGCQFEGVLRSHMVLQDGTVRDTAMFSIIAEEWPEVRSNLIARLGYAPSSG